jgi:diadenosine tetraphosphatase ApaH/serine/threonine PP2A family protein phosphatase
MTPLALLYDVHGNLPALEAVLSDLEAAGAERILLGGDYALFGPFPAQTVAALRSLPDTTWIRGNVERWTAHPDQAPDDELVQGAIEDCRSAVASQIVQELDSLPEQLVIDGTRYCHASPSSDLRSFMPSAQDDEEELLAGVSERRVVFGHTHLQFRRTREDGRELINPGSVGLPMDGDPGAAYALVLEDGSVQLRRVAYDHEASAAAVRDRFGDAPWARRSYTRLKTARP